MAKAIKKIKVIKKKWFKIITPKIFNNVPIGETYVSSVDKVIGKTIKINLKELTRDHKQQKQNIKFEVTEVRSDIGQTKVVYYEIMPSAVKRMIRRGKSRVDISILCTSKENEAVRIKPLIITNYNATKNVQSNLRNAAENIIINYVADTNFDKVFSDVINFRLQRILREQLKKKFPVKICDIRVLKLENKSKLKKSVKGAPKPTKTEAKKSEEVIENKK